LEWLKRIRVIAAVFFFLITSLIFVDYGNVLPGGLVAIVTSLQLAPSVLRALLLLSTLSLGVVFVLVLTLLVGRVYCSTICPLGIFQDILLRIVRSPRQRRRFAFKRPHYTIHYLLLTAAVLLAIFGSMILLNLFEPFSTYGRIVTNIVSPSIRLVNNFLSYLAGLAGWMVLFRMPLLYIDTAVLVFTAMFLALLVFLVYSRGRIFCNLLCPVGALLGVLSRISLFKIAIDPHNCKDCGLCERVCKAECIKSDEKKIDFAACIGCFNCMDVCPTVGMSFRGRWIKQDSELVNIDVNPKRRKVLKTGVLPLLGMFLPEMQSDTSASHRNQVYDENKKHPISPPGSIAVDRFSQLCTACHLCVSSCPTQVLTPSFLEYGLAGMLQPKMNFAANYCNYDCVICSHVCPTGAIMPLEVEAKKVAQIGKTLFVKEDCIVVTKKKDCGACSEHCPTKAVKMIPYEGKLRIPEVTDDICIGCGACEHACPVLPRRAIYVRSNPVHLQAQKPKAQKLEKSFDSSEEFPF
jgi:polyferredoxin